MTVGDRKVGRGKTVHLSACPKPLRGDVSKKGVKNRLETRHSGGGIERLQRVSREKFLARLGGKDGEMEEVEEEVMLRRLASKSCGVVEEEGEDGGSLKGGVGIGHGTRRAFAQHLRKSIGESDVVVEVLDARDPNGCRCEGLEDYCLGEGKRVILLLNKVDLVDDLKVVEGWVKYLSKYYPTIPFRAMTSESRSKKSTVAFTSLTVTTAPKAVMSSGFSPLGASELKGLLRNYCRPSEEGGTMRKITVSIVGMPNVGKSSVINSLCRNTGRVKTGNLAGVTRSLARIKLSDHIELLDTPGVVLEGDESDPRFILRGCVSTFTQAAGEEAVDLLRRHPGMIEQLLRLYKLEDLGEEFCTTSQIRELLGEIAERRKLLLKGGGRDIAAATRRVIEDWKNAKLRAAAVPPMTHKYDQLANSLRP